MTTAHAVAHTRAPDPSAPAQLPSRAALALEKLSWRELMRTFIDGATPDPEALIGWEFRGINRLPLNRLPVARAVGIKKFVKGFFRADDGRTMGYNSPVAMNALDGRWNIAPKRFGFYEVSHVDPTARDNAFLHALLLDYGKGSQRPLDPLRSLRDYVVQVDPGNPDLYLGTAYIAVGPARLGPTSFFILERHRTGPDLQA